jgi:glutathione S-transferase
MLAIKQLAWRSVQTPLVPPKADLEALTGGYRGVPVLQAGADIYVDSQLIALEIERRHPDPTLFPSPGSGMPLALGTWGDALYRAALTIVLATTASRWPEAFRRDREFLFQDIDFATVGARLPQARAQLRAHVALIEQQLLDGRAFLGGAAPGLTDLQSYPFLWLLRGIVPQVAAGLLDDFARLAAWEARLAALGEGQRREIAAGSALDEALAAEPQTESEIDPHDADGLTEGRLVEIAPDDTRRGAVRGEVVVATPSAIAVRRHHERVGTVIVHLPRLGYRVRPLA